MPDIAPAVVLLKGRVPCYGAILANWWREECEFFDHVGVDVEAEISFEGCSTFLEGGVIAEFTIFVFCEHVDCCWSWCQQVERIVVFRRFSCFFR